jgi:hypothetical protein
MMIESRIESDDLARRQGFLGQSVGMLLFLVLLAICPPASSQGQPVADPGVSLSFSTADTLALPGPGKISGITWMGTDTLVVLLDIPEELSESRERMMKLVVQDPQGMVYREDDFTGVLDRGLAWDGEFLYSCGDLDDGSSVLYQVEPDTMTVTEAFDLRGHNPCGMCFDGQYVWVADRDSGRIDRFESEERSITRSVIAPGFSPFGLAFDGRDMWNCDSGTGRMYRLTGSRKNWSATVDIESFMMRGQDVLLLHDGLSLWYIPAGENLAIRVTLK